MKVSYCSDLHCEFLDYPDFSKEKGGDVLLFCGDITTGNILRLIRTDAESKSQKKFFMTKMKTLCEKYTHVYYILGNHEHYGWRARIYDSKKGWSAPHGMSGKIGITPEELDKHLTDLHKL